MDLETLAERVVLIVALMIGLATLYVMFIMTAIGDALTSYHDDPSCAEDVSDESDGEVCQCPRRSDAKWAIGKKRAEGNCEAGKVKSGKCICTENGLPWTWYAFLMLDVIIICVLIRLIYKSFVVNSM
mgnify:CR=1 FL=1